MNKQETAEAIKVMQAWIDGEQIEYNWNTELGDPPQGAKWLPMIVFDWNWDRFIYRLKPKPREFWIDAVQSDLGFFEAYDNEPRMTDNWPYIKVREVIE